MTKGIEMQAFASIVHACAAVVAMQKMEIIRGKISKISVGGWKLSYCKLAKEGTQSMLRMQM